MNPIQKFLFFSRPHPLSRTLAQRIRFLRAKEFLLVQGNGKASILGAFMLSLILHASNVAPMTIAVWFSVALGIALLVFLFERHVRQRLLDKSNFYKLVYYRLGLGIILSATWGSTAFFVPHAEILYMIFLFLAISTMVTLGVLGFGAMPVYFFILDFFGLAPITFMFGFYAFTYQEHFYFLMLLFALIWQTVVLIRGYAISDKVIEQLIYKEQLKEEIEEHKRTKSIIEHLAHHDHLTHIANRRYFESYTRQAIEKAKLASKGIVLMLIDLDNFKPVNDTHGHAVGDKLLQRVATAVAHSVGGEGFVARLGGDEFAVLFEDIENISTIDIYEERLKAAINGNFEIEHVIIENHASIGCANTLMDGATLEELYRIADLKMYADKRANRHP